MIATEAQHHLEMMQSVHNATVAAFGASSTQAAQSAAKLASAEREAIKAEVRAVLCEFPDASTVTVNIRFIDAAGVKSELIVRSDDT
mgnify:FL=1